ncbi:MAG: DUF1501 domain-containing protein, partial [Chromatiales bacterium]|nr:DUF1501 domain-containing protein [Chromatiales bacterium]
VELLVGTLRRFDTHARQLGPHARLLEQLGEALGAFRDVMRDAGRWNDVSVATYGEFGRRVRANGTGGTDHGTAAPHLLLGGRVRGGLYGAQPSLTRLVDNELRHSVHLRDYYASLVSEWWNLPAASIRDWRAKGLGLFV